MVGTRPMLRPARRSGASASRSSATVRTVLMRPRRRPAPACGATSSSKRSSSSGATSATARRWAATVASSPRATGPVSARSGPSSARLSTRAAQQRHEQPPGLVRLQARAGGDPLGRRLERDQEVGGHRRGGVVGGAALVVDLERRHAQHAREIGGEGERRGRGRPRSHSRRPRTRRSPPASAAKVWSGCRPKAAAPAGASALSGVAPLVCPTSGAAPATAAAAASISRVGHAQDDRGAAARHLAAARRALDLDAGLAQAPLSARAEPRPRRRRPRARR